MPVTNEESKALMLQYRNELFDHYAIYHQRVTILIRIIEFDISDVGVSFTAKPIKALKHDYGEKFYKLRLYQERFLELEEFQFSCPYIFGDVPSIIPELKLLGGWYSPFTLWLDPELTKLVTESDSTVTSQIADYLLVRKDWKVFLKS